MKEEEFRSWLTGKMQSRPVSDCISRCRRIEQQLRVDLDAEFEANGGAGIVEALSYSAEDQASGLPAPEGLIFKEGANIRNGMNSLKSAASNYMRFRSGR